MDKSHPHLITEFEGLLDRFTVLDQDTAVLAADADEAPAKVRHDSPAISHGSDSGAAVRIGARPKPDPGHQLTPGRPEEPVPPADGPDLDETLRPDANSAESLGNSATAGHLHPQHREGGGARGNPSMVSPASFHQSSRLIAFQKDSIELTSKTG